MSSQLGAPNSESAILARLIQAKEDMNREVAQYLLSIDFSQDDIERMNFLAERAREATGPPTVAVLIILTMQPSGRQRSLAAVQ